MEKLHMYNLDLNSDLHIRLVGRSQFEDQLSRQDFVVFLRLSRQKLGWCLKLGLSCFPHIVSLFLIYDSVIILLFDITELCILASHL